MPRGRGPSQPPRRPAAAPNTCTATSPRRRPSTPPSPACGSSRARLDQLVLSAGGFFRKIGFEESDDEEWRQILDLNLSSAFYCLRAAFPLLRENGAARVVCVGSLAGVTASHSSPAYSAAKAGAHELARMAAFHLAPYGAAVNAIAPGTTHSARVDKLHGAEYMSQLEKTIPAGRLGEVEDIVAAILFYVSPEAAYTTGTTLNVSGGRFIS